MEDLYIKKESDIIYILASNFDSWSNFNEATTIIKTNQKPNYFYISFNTKKRNVIPLVQINNSVNRIIDCSDYSKNFYYMLQDHQDTKYAYVEKIKKI